MIRFVGALIITYFLSRGFRRLGLKGTVVKLLAAHVLSGGVVFAGLFLLRFPLYVLHKEQLIPYIVAQFLWLAYDLYRARIAFWKPPVVGA